MCTSTGPACLGGQTGALRVQTLPSPHLEPDLRAREESCTTFCGPLLRPPSTEAGGQMDLGLNLPQFSPGPVTSDNSFKPL